MDDTLLFLHPLFIPLSHGEGREVPPVEDVESAVARVAEVPREVGRVWVLGAQPLHDLARLDLAPRRLALGRVRDAEPPRGRRGRWRRILLCGIKFSSIVRID